MWNLNKSRRRCLTLLLFFGVCCLSAVSSFSDGSKLSKGSATTRKLYCNRQPKRRAPLHFDSSCNGYCEPRSDFDQFYNLTISNTTYWLDVVRVNISAKPKSGKSVTGFSIYAIDESGHVAGSMVEDDTDVVVGTCNDLIQITDETHAGFHKMADHNRKNISIQWQPDGYNHGRVKFVLWVVNNHSDIYSVESQWLTSQKHGSDTLDVKTTLDKVSSAIDIKMFEDSFKYRSMKGYNLDLTNPFSDFSKSPSKNDLVPANLTGSNGGSDLESGSSPVVTSQPVGSGSNVSSGSEVAASNGTSSVNNGSLLDNRDMSAVTVNNANETKLFNLSKNKLNNMNDTNIGNVNNTDSYNTNGTNIGNVNNTDMNGTNMDNGNGTRIYNVNDTNIGRMNDTNISSSINDTNISSSMNDTNISSSMNNTNISSSINDTNISSSMNDTNISRSINDTNISSSSMNDTNISSSMNDTNNSRSMNDTNISSSMNDTNISSSMNDTNISRSINDTNIGNVNNTNLYSMNGTNIGNMSNNNTGNLNDTNIRNVNNPDLYNMNDTNTVNGTNMDTVNNTSLDNMSRANMVNTNDTIPYNMNETNTENLNDTNPYNNMDTDMNSMNDTIVRNLTLTPANRDSQTKQRDNTTTLNIPYTTQSPGVGTNSSQFKEPGNSTQLNTTAAPISTTPYPNLSDSQTTTSGNINVYTSTNTVSDMERSGSQNITGVDNNIALNNFGNTSGATPSSGTIVAGRGTTVDDGGYPTTTYPEIPAADRMNISFTPPVPFDRPGGNTAGVLRPAAM